MIVLPVVSQEPEPLFKVCVEQLVEELHIQKLSEPHVTVKEWLLWATEAAFQTDTQVGWTWRGGGRVPKFLFLKPHPLGELSTACISIWERHEDRRDTNDEVMLE